MNTAHATQTISSPPGAAMSSAAPSTSAAPETLRHSALTRILRVVRLQYVNTYAFVWVPAMVLGAAILVSLAIYAMIGSDQPMYGGGSLAPLWYYIAVGVQALTLTFPFSQAMSLARREFFLGTLLAAGLSAAMLALIYVLLGLVERATGGYGINGYLAYLPWLWEHGWTSAAALIFTMVFTAFILGFWFATIYYRGGMTVLTIVLIGLCMLLLAAAFVITRIGAWGDIVQAVAGLGSFGAAGVLVLISAVLVIASWVTLRRLVP